MYVYVDVCKIEYIFLFVLFYCVIALVAKVMYSRLITVDENIIATIKTRNYFGYPLKMAIAILDFSLLLPI